MKRRILNIRSALSLVLCVAMAMLWVRSYWLQDGLWHVGGDSCSAVSVASDCGRIGTATMSYKRPLRRPPPNGWYAQPAKQLPAYDGDPGWRLLGFAAAARSDIFGRDSIIVIIPHWSLVGVFAALPARWLLLRRRVRLMESQGLCPACGYDLRASKERCPECGMAVLTTESKA